MKGASVIGLQKDEIGIQSATPFSCSPLKLGTKRKHEAAVSHCSETGSNDVSSPEKNMVPGYTLCTKGRKFEPTSKCIHASTGHSSTTAHFEAILLKFIGAKVGAIPSIVPSQGVDDEMFRPGKSSTSCESSVSVSTECHIWDTDTSAESIIQSLSSVNGPPTDEVSSDNGPPTPTYEESARKLDLMRRLVRFPKFLAAGYRLQIPCERKEFMNSSKGNRINWLMSTIVPDDIASMEIPDADDLYDPHATIDDVPDDSD